MSEKSRLNALYRYRILDTPREEAFDDIAKLAASICGVPISAITLVDQDRQWFKASEGLTVRETKRHIAFCSYAIQSHETMIVEDAAADSRFVDNPLVSHDPKIRFYAGAPIVTPDGEAIGSLCVVDFVPRSISKEQQTDLERLSKQVVRLLEGRLRELEVEDAKNQLEIKVAERTADLTTLHESIPQIVWQMAPDGGILSVNGRWEDYTGKKAMRTSFGELVHPEDVKVIMADWVICKKKGLDFNGECRLKGRDGEYRWFLSRAVAQKDAEGKVIKWFGTLTDIHESKEAEEIQNNFFKLPNVMLALASSTGYFVRLNEAWSETLGHSKEKLLTSGWLDFVHPEDIERTNLETDKLGSGVDSLNFENRYRCADGSYKWLHWTSVPRDGLFYCVARDITYLKEAERAARNSELRLHKVFSSKMMGICYWDSTGNISDANDAYLEMIGYTREDLQSGELKWNKITPADQLYLDDIAQKEIALKGSCTPFEKDYIHKKGHRVPILIGAASLDTQEAGVCFVVDLTQQKSAVAREQMAYETSKAKSEFLANMSHEIRTPINGVLGIAGLLRDTNLDAQQKEFVETIVTSADSLLTVINDILDFSKIEAGKLDLEMVDFDLKSMISETVKMQEYTAAMKDLGLEVLRVPKSRRYINADSGRLRQILTNLINNAIKFTETGKVSVWVDLEETGKDSAQLWCEVRDTGIGISETGREKLFQAFTQADSSTTRKFGGTGLGLSICKQLVEVMGGKIGVNSREGKGSTFWFRIPVEYGEEISASSGLEKRETPSQDLFKGRRVLIAEDNPINRLVAVKQLESLGIQASAVANGKEAVNALKSAPFELILMDCQMPELDGFEATIQIRSDQTQPLRKVPIIALTANVVSGVREQCLSSGMDDYLAKPVEMEDLISVLNRWLKAA